MIKKVKSNKLLSIAILSLCVVIIFNPKFYANSCLNAITVWSVNVLPVLFPFFVFTRLIIYLTPPRKSVLDKPFTKIFRSPAGSSFIFALSVLSGYPMGAKLISNVFVKGNISRDEAESMLSYCSISGPMFMIGSVGVGIFLSFKAGVIILLSNVLACLINGFIFRLKKDKSARKEHIKDYKSLNATKIETKQTDVKQADKSSILTDSVYDSLVSILMVGAYIALSFLIIDIFKSLHVFSFLADLISNFRLDTNTVQAVLCGLIEITRGCIEVNACNLSLAVKTIIASGLIGFGGVSVLLQSINFTNNLHIKFSHMLKQKLCQGVLSTLFAILLCLICF